MFKHPYFETPQDRQRISPAAAYAATAAFIADARERQRRTANARILLATA